MKSIYDPKVAKSKVSHLTGVLLANKIRYERSYAENVAIRKRNWEGCLLRLTSFAADDALRAWFIENDSKLFRQASYCSGALQRMYYLTEDPSQYGAGGEAFKLLTPLLSDCEPLISWFAGAEFYAEKSRNLLRTAKYRAYQSFLALRGDFDQLGARSQAILSNTDAVDKKMFLSDHRYFVALAAGDRRGMERAIFEVANNKARWMNYESGATEGLISTSGTIYTKIAWRHGFEIDPGTPFVPMAWMPIEPLPEYLDPYPFMKEYALR